MIYIKIEFELVDILVSKNQALKVFYHEPNDFLVKVVILSCTFQELYA